MPVTIDYFSDDYLVTDKMIGAKAQIYSGDKRNKLIDTLTLIISCFVCFFPTSKKVSI